MQLSLPLTNVNGGDLVNVRGTDCHLGLKLLFCSVLVFYYWFTASFSYFAVSFGTKAGKEFCAQRHFMLQMPSFKPSKYM